MRSVVAHTMGKARIKKQRFSISTIVNGRPSPITPLESGRTFTKNKYFELLPTTIQVGFKDYVVSAPMIYVHGAFFVFGGSIGEDYKSYTIGRLDEQTWTWSKAGNLNSGRCSSNAVFDGSVILVVGGYDSNDRDTLPTEKCDISGAELTCTAQSPVLDMYRNFPEVFLVPSDFCQN